MCVPDTSTTFRDGAPQAEEFIARYMADVRIAGPAFAGGWDRTMFPRGDWEAMASGDYECTGVPTPRSSRSPHSLLLLTVFLCSGVPTPGAVPGALPIKIEALPEGSIVAPGVAFFKSNKDLEHVVAQVNVQFEELFKKIAQLEKQMEAKNASKKRPKTS